MQQTRTEIRGSDIVGELTFLNLLLPNADASVLTQSLLLGCPVKRKNHYLDLEDSVCSTTLTESLPEHLAVSQGLLQLKQALFVLVLLHDHASHFRAGEVTRRGGHQALNSQTHPNSMNVRTRSSDRRDKKLLTSGSSGR